MPEPPRTRTGPAQIEVMAANLASLNDLFTELVTGLPQADDAYKALVRQTLAGFTRALGYQPAGEEPRYDDAPLDQALAGLRQIAEAQGRFKDTWACRSIPEVAATLAAWCAERRAGELAAPDGEPEAGAAARRRAAAELRRAIWDLIEVWGMQFPTADFEGPEAPAAKVAKAMTRLQNAVAAVEGAPW